MNAVINFKTDKKIKTEAQKIAGQMGLTLSDVMNLYLREFIVKKELLVTAHQDESRPSKMLLGAIKESRRNLRDGDISPAFSNAKNAISWLNSKNKKFQNGKICR